MNEIEAKRNKNIKTLLMELWFMENELYSDGSNTHSWLPKLKLKLNELFKLSLEEKK